MTNYTKNAKQQPWKSNGRSTSCHCDISPCLARSSVLADGSLAILSGYVTILTLL